MSLPNHLLELKCPKVLRSLKHNSLIFFNLIVTIVHLATVSQIHGEYKFLLIF